jgi:hypothetical protein
MELILRAWKKEPKPEPEPEQIIYRANIPIAETGDRAQQALAQYPGQAVFQLKEGAAAGSLKLDQSNVAGEGRRPANVNRAPPTNFCGGPDEIVAQLNEAREEIGCIVDLSCQTPGSEGAVRDPRHLKQEEAAGFRESLLCSLGATCPSED